MTNVKGPWVTKRPLNRIPRIIEKLLRLWAKNPDARFIQLVWYIMRGQEPEFYLEDTKFERRLNERLRKSQEERKA